MRKINSLKNFLSVAIPFLIMGILGFFRVRFFITSLGEDISSLNQLFNNLLAYLALAEGGIGLFVVQKYYKCFVDKDHKRITEIFTASKRYFHIVSLIILVAGLILSFFLSFLTNNNLSLGFMQSAFIIFLFRYVIEYWFYAPRFVIQADQKLYKVNYYLNAIRIMEMVAEIVLLKLISNYLLILIPGTVIRLIGYPLVNKTIYKLYPFLKNPVKYNPTLLKGFHNIISQKVAGLVFENTDVIIVSAFLTPVSVIIYTSYNYISKYLNDITYMISSSAMSSMGNAIYQDSKEKSFAIFNKFNIMFIFVATIASFLFFVLISPFIIIWVGDKYLASTWTAYLFTMVLFINIIKKPIHMIKDNLGLFKETKTVILLEALINVGLSLLLVRNYAINGILIATIIASLLTTFWYIPLYIYKNYFKKSLLSYYFPLGVSLILITLGFIIIKCIGLTTINLGGWLVIALVLSICCLLVFFLIYYVLFSSFKELIVDLKLMIGGGKNAKKA